ncbi:MAG: glycosyltransferase family 39 protein [Chloroflexi bacterium]|nr:glycosyltransferase family 39 protein [Chloroflexota bacterium]
MKGGLLPARALLPALVATLLGFGLRVFRLGEQSLWYDEAFSVLLAVRPLPSIVAGTALDTMPPLYYLLLHAWGLPAGDFWVRFPSAFFGTLTVPLTFAVGTRLLGPRVGLLAALITAVAPFQVFFGQEARMYGLLGALSLLTVYWFLRMGRRDLAAPALGGQVPRLAFVCAGALAVYTHALAWLTVGSLGLWWLLAQRGRFWRDPGTVLAFLGVGALYLPWAGILVEQAQRVQGSFWTPPPTPLTPLASLYVFTFGPFLPAPRWSTAGIVLVLLVFVLALVAARARLADSHGRAGLGFVLFWLGMPLALAYLLSQLQPIYLERTLIGASYGLYLLLAWGLLYLRPRPVAWGLGVAGLCLVGVALGRWYFDPAAGKPPLRSAAVAIAQAWQEGDAIIHTGDGSYLPLRVYLPDRPQELLDGDPEFAAGTARAQSTLRVIGAVPVSAEHAAAGYRRVWLVLAPDHSPEFQQAAAQEFGRGRRLLAEQRFAGIVLRRYE